MIIIIDSTFSKKKRDLKNEACLNINQAEARKSLGSLDPLAAVSQCFRVSTTGWLDVLVNPLLMVKNWIAQCLPVNLQGLRKLKHVIVVVKQGGDANCEVELQHFPFIFLVLDVSYREPRVVVTFRAPPLGHECDVRSLEVLRHQTHDVCRHVGVPKVVRVHLNTGILAG